MQEHVGVEESAGQLRRDVGVQHAAVECDAAAALSNAAMLHELQALRLELEMQHDSLRRSQVALEESRDRYVDFHDFAPVGYLTLKEDGQIAEINLAGAEMLGMERKELLQRRFSQSVATGAIDLWQKHFTDALREDAKQMCELQLLRPDGVRIDVRLDSLRLTKGGKTPVLRVVLTDITERKQMEGKINQLNRDFVSFLENTSDFIYLKDENSRFRFCSQTLADITGHRSWRDMIGKHDLEVFPPEIAQIYNDEEVPIFREARPLLNKVDPYLDAGGRKRWVSTCKWPLLDHEGSGKVVGLFGISRDITERKQTDEALKASEQRFRDIVNTTDGIVWEADATTFTFTFISQQAERLLGFAAEDWLQPGFWVENLHPDDQVWAPEYCASYTGRAEPHDFEYRFIAKDGRTVWLHDIVTVVKEDGAARWLRGIMVDVTHRKLAEEQLREMAANLEAMVQERTKQLRRLSAQLTMTEERERRLLARDLHDNLGQLLAVIKIKLTSLVAGSLQGPINQVVELVDQAEHSARSITLELSPPILHTLGLVPALEWLADEVERVYGIGVQLDADICRNLLGEEIQAMLYRSVRELLINVAKHADVNEASVTCLCQGGQLMIVVSDDGRGFDPGDRGGFSSGQSSFGLSSIYERIVNIGGSMEVDSSPGHGTTVTLAVACSIAKKEAGGDSHCPCR